MKPVTTVEAYACSSCGRVFEKTLPKWALGLKTATEKKVYRERMKYLAATCCLCPKCNKKCDRYSGTNDKLCTSCKREDTWAFVVEQLTRALAEYKYMSTQRNRRDLKIEEKMSQLGNEQLRKGIEKIVAETWGDDDSLTFSEARNAISHGRKALSKLLGRSVSRQ